MITLEHYTALSAVLFCVGLYGAITSHSLIRLVLCAELMLNAANLNLVASAFSATTGPASGLSAVVLVMVVSAAEVGVALALVVALSRTGDVSAMESFRRLGERREPGATDATVGSPDVLPAPPAKGA